MFSYKLLFSKEKIHIFYLLNCVFLYIFLWSSSCKGDQYSPKMVTTIEPSWFDLVNHLSNKIHRDKETIVVPTMIFLSFFAPGFCYWLIPYDPYDPELFVYMSFDLCWASTDAVHSTVHRITHRGITLWLWTIGKT